MSNGLVNLIEFNFLREKEAFIYNEETAQFSVDMAKMKAAVRDLARVLLVLEGEGNYENAGAFIAKYGKVD